ncbi:hypothetical protein KXW39_002469 [Aspergillus fumigatus]|nr:hypothetical protein KXW38_003086 [Aspergillus fumigatus]KAH2906644.1 hypothetical protein KXW25_006601 [Aspergillus fumigatus]KAH3294638.1 hypothetical protein KXV87_006754 [Aspergillus fumigatus]KAH3434725.1 hypothetical protein KXW39_002469 [Aspergillus fumigatus]KAH3520822.1 hypothetical protein KXV64_006360 [Aspergillus fumigatus]
MAPIAPPGCRAPPPAVDGHVIARHGKGTTPSRIAPRPTHLMPLLPVHMAASTPLYFYISRTSSLHVRRTFSSLFLLPVLLTAMHCPLPAMPRYPSITLLRQSAITRWPPLADGVADYGSFTFMRAHLGFLYVSQLVRPRAPPAPFLGLSQLR